MMIISRFTPPISGKLALVAAFLTLALASCSKDDVSSETDLVVSSPADRSFCPFRAYWVISTIQVEVISWGYYGLGDCLYIQGVWCLKSDSVLSIQFFSRYLPFLWF